LQKSTTQNFIIVTKWKLADFLDEKYLKQLYQIGKGGGLTS
jgi:hypothetical protein